MTLVDGDVTRVKFNRELDREFNLTRNIEMMIDDLTELATRDHLSLAFGR